MILLENLPIQLAAPRPRVRFVRTRDASAQGSARGSRDITAEARASAVSSV
jgi:hypothetical protein